MRAKTGSEATFLPGIAWRSVAQAVDLYAHHFGPTIRGLEHIGPKGVQALKTDLAAVVEAHNVETDGSVAMQADYALVRAIRA